MDASMFNGLAQVLFVLFIFAVVGILTVLAAVVYGIYWLCTHVAFV